MALNLPVFYQRTGSAIVFAAVMLAGLLWDQWSFLALICLIGVLCLRDYIRLMKKIDSSSAWPIWLPVSVQLLGLYFIAISYNWLHSKEGTPFEFLNDALPIAFVIPAILLITSVLNKKNMVNSVMHSLGGLFYITLPMIFLLMMWSQNFILPIALILMIWTNDTMAYLVGSFIGKTPFSPISPKKTWEGTGGGALLTMIGAMTYGYFSGRFRLVDWAVLGLCAGIAGTLGDLVESKLKRMADVKDSGTLMPGHGGALDRFDSLLLAAPFAGAYVIMFMRP